MALITLIPRSIRPNSGALVLGIGKGSGTSLADLFKIGSSAGQVVDIRARADTDSGSDARVIYARLHQYGAGGGEAVRAYAFANASGVATGGTLNGIHASLSIAASSSISGAGNAARMTIEAASESRTLGGTCAALALDSNIGASNTVPATWSFIRLSKVGSVDLATFLNIEDDQCLKGSAASGSGADALPVRMPNGSTLYIPLVAAS